MLMRLFLAIAVDDNVRETIFRFSNKLQSAFAEGLKAVNPAKYHLTLHFLGDTSEPELQSLKAICDTVAQSIKASETTLSTVGCFPEGGPVRVVFAGVQTCQTLNQIYAQLKDALIEGGFPTEERGFTPHITVARTKRFNRHAEARSFLKTFPSLHDTRLVIDAISVIESQMSELGSEYTEIHRAALHR